MGIQVAVGMTTCPRSVDYSRETMGQVSLAGFRFCQSYFDEHKARGSYGNFRQALRQMLFHNPVTIPADAFLIVQDDIQMTSGLAEFLQTYLFENRRVWNERTGVVSLYCAACDHNNDPGWHRLIEPAQGKMHGALAVLMPRPAALKFDADPPQPGAMTMTENWLAEFCQRENLNIWLHNPSFVRHIGDVSAINADGPQWPAEHIAKYRQCAEFCESIESLKTALAKAEQEV